MPMIPNVLESVSVPSPASDESVCQPVSVPQNTQKESDPSVREQQGKTGFINTTVYSCGDTSIRKAYQETRHSGSVMSPVHVIMQGDWTLYWRLTLKPKRKECYILVLYRKVLPPITKILQQRRENRRNRYYERLTYHHHLAERIVFRVTMIRRRLR